MILLASTDECLAAAACECDGRVWHLDAPARHRHVLARMAQLGFDRFGDERQGFLTNFGRFVDQKEARELTSSATIDTL